MDKEDLHRKTNELIRWASDLGKKHNVSTTTILSQFYRLKTAGASVEQAIKDIEEVYAS